ASTALGLAAMVAWVAAGAQFSISETTKVLGRTTKPQLGTTWFSSAYWRIAGIAALLTLPFLFAAAVQALLGSDLALLTRAAFAALVWPSRRVWAVRSVELLVALVLSKLAIVAVLELGGAALDQLGHHGLAGVMAGLSGTALLLLAALSPWAVLRLVPMAELAGGAVDSLRAGATTSYQRADAERRGAEHKLVEL